MPAGASVDVANAAPSLKVLLDRLTVFMTLVGLTALLVGRRRQSAMRCPLISADEPKPLPRSNAWARRAASSSPPILSEILVIALGGIAAGLVIGALAPFAVAPLLPAQLPIAARLALYPMR